VAGTRGVSFEHKNGTVCTDVKFHRHCQGRWRGSVSLGFDAEGKRIRRRVTAATKTAVLEAMAELREELGRAPRSSRKYTVNEAVAEWLEGGLPGRSERTKKAYKEALAPLLAKIGHRPLRELTPMEVRKGLEALAPRYSTRYLQIAHNSLERAIRFGQIHQRVSGNVAELIEVPKGETGRPSKSLTLAQAQDLIRAAEGERLYPYIVVSLLSGIRTEETRALRWDHVDLLGDPRAVPPVPPHIDVWRAERAGGDVKTPKSRRSLRLPDLCVEALSRQWDQQNKDRLIAGEKWQENDLVFASTVGTPLLNGNVRRSFRSIINRAGIAGEWTPREMRHTFVSLMSESGMAIEEISRLVGHSSSNVTETVYRMELRPVIRSGADAMDKLFPGSAPESGQSTEASPDSDPPAGTVRRRPRRTTDTTRSADSDLPVHRKRRVIG
jgi:integrase